jgi:hypothetical protein
MDNSLYRAALRYVARGIDRTGCARVWLVDVAGLAVCGTRDHSRWRLAQTLSANAGRRNAASARTMACTCHRARAAATVRSIQARADRHDNGRVHALRQLLPTSQLHIPVVRCARPVELSDIRQPLVGRTRLWRLPSGPHGHRAIPLSQLHRRSCSRQYRWQSHPDLPDIGGGFDSCGHAGGVTVWSTAFEVRRRLRCASSKMRAGGSWRAANQLVRSQCFTPSFQLAPSSASVSR